MMVGVKPVTNVQLCVAQKTALFEATAPNRAVNLAEVMEVRC